MLKFLLGTIFGIFISLFIFNKEIEIKWNWNDEEDRKE